MKKLYENALSFIMCILVLTACQEYKIDSQIWGDTAKVETDARDTYSVLGTQPSDIVFNISSNTPWSVKSNKEWCKPQPAMSATAGLIAMVTVEIDSNPTKQPRTAVLTIKAEGLEDKLITITQDAPSQFAIIKPSENAKVDGGEIRFGIRSNKPWTVTTTSMFLIDMDKTSGEGDETGEKVEYVTITVPANEGARRSGSITVKTELEERIFAIIQEGSFIDVSEQSLTFSESGETKEVTVTTSTGITWDVEVPEEYNDFLTVQKRQDGNTVAITMNPNTGFMPREGEIIVKELNNPISAISVPIKFSQTICFTFNGIYNLDNGWLHTQGSPNATVIHSNYFIKKGKLIFKFKEIHIEGGACIDLEGREVPWSNNTNANFKFSMEPAKTSSGLKAGGSIGGGSVTGKFTYNIVNSIKEVVMELIPATPSGKLTLVLFLNGKEEGRIENLNDIWQSDPDRKLELNVKVWNFHTNAEAYFDIESIKYIPYPYE